MADEMGLRIQVIVQLPIVPMITLSLCLISLFTCFGLAFCFLDLFVLGARPYVKLASYIYENGHAIY